MTITRPPKDADGSVPEYTTREPSSGALGREGWVRFGLLLVSRGYLAVMATLAIIALLPILLGWRPMIILSGSMEPTISVGDVVLTSDMPAGQTYGDGMVVAFETVTVGDEPIIKMHRIVETRDDGFITQGDANADRDSGTLTENEIHGAGRLLVPFIGLPVYWMGRDPLALAAWVLGTLVAVGLALPTPSRARRSEQLVIAALATAAIVAGAASPSAHAYAAFTVRTTTSATWGAAALPHIAVGRAEPFALLAATSLTDGLFTFTDISGSIGTTPGTTISNFSVLDRYGPVERNTNAARVAMADARTLASALEARPSTPRTGILTGRVTPGIYSWKTLSASGTITLDAARDPSARFVFIADSLTVANNTNVVLSNGATATNVYWRIRGTATLNTSTMRGTLLADGAITANTATVFGRLISLNGSISANRYTIAEP
jgi:signal peptidase I